MRDVLLLKKIPSYIVGDPPQICQLVAIGMSARAEALPARDSWVCSGSISWGVTSTEDPWGQTKITKIIEAYYSSAAAAGFGEGGGLASGYLVHDYLK